MKASLYAEPGVWLWTGSWPIAYGHRTRYIQIRLWRINDHYVRWLRLQTWFLTFKVSAPAVWM